MHVGVSAKHKSCAMSTKIKIKNRKIYQFFISFIRFFNPICSINYLHPDIPFYIPIVVQNNICINLVYERVDRYVKYTQLSSIFEKTFLLRMLQFVCTKKENHHVLDLSE